MKVNGGCGILDLTHMAKSLCMRYVRLDLQWLPQLSGVQACEMWIEIRKDGPVDYTHGKFASYDLLLEALGTSEDISLPMSMRARFSFRVLQDRSDGLKVPRERVRPSWLLGSSILTILFCADTLSRVCGDVQDRTRDVFRNGIDDIYEP